MLNYKRLFVPASTGLQAALFLAFLLVLAFLAALPNATALSPLHICQEGCTNDRIQEAIVNASPGDTIVVESGVYKDPLIIGRPVKLEGQDTGRGKPILDPEKGRVILAAQGAVLSGFDLSGTQPSGIEGDDCSLEVILPAAIYLNDFSDRNSVCPEDLAAWNSSDRISYRYNSRVLRSPLGNYWADYSGIDEDGNGIGDEPVVLNEDNIDYYPLMLPSEYYLISDSTGTNKRPEIELIQARVGEKFSIPLSANPTTGYNWYVDYDYILLSLQSSDYIASSSKALGGSGKSIFVFEPQKPGKTTIYFVYKRSWENIVADARAFQVEISA